jgi:hypothetical protein
MEKNIKELFFARSKFCQPLLLFGSIGVGTQGFVLARQAGALSLEPHFQPFLLWLLWR